MRIIHYADSLLGCALGVCVICYRVLRLRGRLSSGKIASGLLPEFHYTEAVQQLEEMGLEAEAWLSEVRRILIVQADVILMNMPEEHAHARRARIARGARRARG